MPNYIVLGAQWGDEGKGKVVDALAEHVDMVVRFQGGANAGHTIVIAGRKHILHLLPSGILSPGIISVIGNGCVIDVEALAQEIRDLRDEGLEISPENLIISDRAHIVTPMHRHIDRREGQEIGTTGRGIGPAYTDKVRRQGLPIAALRDASFEARLVTQDATWQRLLDASSHYATDDDIPPGATDRPDLREVHETSEGRSRLRNAIADVAPFVRDTRAVIYDATKAGRSILFEGAQGMLLDVDHGTYPYVTSSNTTIGAAYTGSGVWLDFHHRIGVVKAYTTRVGQGPFPTEDLGPRGIALQEAGHEFGATTGRPRRCGWLDIPSLREACITNGYNALVLTKLDVLTGMETIPVAVDRAPDGAPIYEERPGWDTPLRGATSDAELPRACLDYITFIEDALDVPVALVSYGPDRAQTLTRRSLCS